MRGFLARAGHALGRLLVSFGYGGVGGNQVDAACLETAIAVDPSLRTVVSAARDVAEIAFASLATALTRPSFEFFFASPQLATVLVATDMTTSARILIPRVASELPAPSIESTLWKADCSTQLGTTALATVLSMVNLRTKVEGDC